MKITFLNLSYYNDHIYIYIKRKNYLQFQLKKNIGFFTFYSGIPIKFFSNTIITKFTKD